MNQPDSTFNFVERIYRLISALRLGDCSLEIQREQRAVCAELGRVLKPGKLPAGRTRFDITERAFQFLTAVPAERLTTPERGDRDSAVAAMKAILRASPLYKTKRTERRTIESGVKIYVDHGYDDLE